MSFCDLAVSGVAELQPYVPGKPIEELQRQYGVRDVIKLASNENPLGPSKAAMAAVAQSAKEMTRYPDGNGYALKMALAEKAQLAPEQITLGNGSNDVLELVARAFAGAGDEVVYSEHAFAVYPIVTKAIGATGVAAAAKDYGHDLAAILKAISSRTKIVFIANPNNPTGTWIEPAEIKAFLEKVPDKVLVVLDEAYVEYLEQQENTIAWLQDFHNLIITRTFSKAYGLAGLRIGYAMSHPEVADLLNRVRQPFNANSLAQAAAVAALGDENYLVLRCSLARIFIIRSRASSSSASDRRLLTRFFSSLVVIASSVALCFSNRADFMSLVTSMFCSMTTSSPIRKIITTTGIISVKLGQKPSSMDRRRLSRKSTNPLI